MTKNTDEMGKKEITISFDMFEQWESLTDEEAGRLVKEIGSYVCYGTETTTPATKAMFATYKKQIDEARQKNKGGAPVGNRNAAKQPKQPKTTSCLEENEEENEEKRSKKEDKEEDKEEEKKTHSVKEKSERKNALPLYG